MGWLSDLADMLATNAPLFANGLWLTVELLVLSSALALLIAVPIAVARVSGSAAARAISLAYVQLFRGTPLLAQLFLIYYGLAQFDAVRGSALWPILREPWPCALIALTLNGGAYFAEALRGGRPGAADERDPGAPARV